MKFLKTDSLLSVQDFAARAQAWCVANISGYNAVRWSWQYQDAATSPVTFAIMFEPTVAEAFTDAELGTTRDGSGAVTGYTNVEESDLYRLDESEEFYIGKWHKVPGQS